MGKRAKLRGHLSLNMTRILFNLLSSHPELDAPSFALLELVPAQARKFLELHRRSRSFLDELTADGLVSAHLSPSFALPDYAFIPLDFSLTLDDLMLEVDGLLVLQDHHVSVLAHEKLELHNLSEADDFRIHLDEAGVSFSCSFEMGDATVHSSTASLISTELLIRLANSG